MIEGLVLGGIDIPLAGLLILLMTATVYDLKARRVPNALIGVGLIGTLFVLPTLQVLPLLHAITGGLLGLVLFLPFYAMGWMGAGDVKLLALVGSALGPSALIQSTVYIFIAGGIVTLIYLLARRNEPPTQNIPYAVAISGGVLSYLIIHIL
jgi:prepilin peptidase CpaA